MSGSGGSGPRRPNRTSTRGVGGPGDPATPNACLLIDELVRISSPDPQVLGALAVGQVLELQSTDGAAPVLALTADGAAAGSIVPSSLQTLVDCMIAGFSYQAVVQSVKGGILRRPSDAAGLTSMPAVIGGTYRETCASPFWDQLYGSGLRAALACCRFLPPDTELDLHTWVSPDERGELECRTKGHPIRLRVSARSQPVEFWYEHPLSSPTIHPPPEAIACERSSPLQPDAALVFGLLEAHAVVEAERAVYDPQAGPRAIPFSATGSRAQRLCVVANLAEAAAMAERAGCRPGAGAPDELGRALLEAESAEAVVVKDGAHGAVVVTAGTVEHVLCYETDEVFSIGSGDVFSAIFWSNWAIRGMPPGGAAEIASRAAAYYCNSRSLPIPSDVVGLTQGLKPVTPRGNRRRPRVYLAGPLFDVPQRWFIEETKRCLEEAGFDVFSPLHEVGCAGTAREIASADLAGLDASDMVFALIGGGDPGTMFEIGHARKTGKPVVAYGESVADRDLTMLAGTGVTVFRDYCTAVYRAAWTAIST